MRTALDTSVLSALWSGEPTASQIEGQLDSAYAEGGLVISAPVYAELLAHPKVTVSFVDQFLLDTNIVVDFDLGQLVWLRAAKAFANYADRRRSSKVRVPKRLPADFIIAAHASISADRLMTLDATRYRQDFSELRLI